MFRSPLVRAARVTSTLASRAATAAPAAVVAVPARGVRKTVFLTPQDALKQGAVAENFPTPAGVIPTAYAGFSLSADQKMLVAAPRTPEEAQFATTARGEPRFSFRLPSLTSPYMIDACVRTQETKGANYRARMNGQMPSVIVSPAKDSRPMNVYVDPVDMERVGAFRNVFNYIYHVRVEGFAERLRCIIKQWTRDAVTGKTNHVQFSTVDAGHDVRVKIPVVLEGADDSVGVKRGGIILQPTRSIKLTYKPAIAARMGIPVIPSALHINVVDRAVGDTLHAYNVPLPPFLELDARHSDYRHVLLTFSKNLG